MLAEVLVDGSAGLAWKGEKLDALRTYCANCKDAPALPLVVLPGFSKAALEKYPSFALVRFNHFARSQFGQRRHLCVQFQPAEEDSGYPRLWATFGDKVAKDYTLHAKKLRQNDLYVGVTAGYTIKALETLGE